MRFVSQLLPAYWVILSTLVETLKQKNLVQISSMFSNYARISALLPAIGLKIIC